MHDSAPPGDVQPRVHLVGAGPGDPGLITVKGRDALAAAEVVIYDRLIHPGVLALAPSDAEFVYVGKSRGDETLCQEAINERLVALGRSRRRVVRLKGGDPFVFGRGGEEAEALARAGIPFEVVPGITSAIAAPTSIGIPVTDRRFASAVTFVSGHVPAHDPASRVDWSALARSGSTLVILMGMRHVREIAEALIAGGLSPSTPAAAIAWATYERQLTAMATVGSLAEEIVSRGLEAPAVIVVGEVVAMRERLDAVAERALAMHLPA